MNIFRVFHTTGTNYITNLPHKPYTGQRSFSRRFGPLQTHVEATSHLAGYDDVNLISNLKRPDGQPTGLYGQHVESYHSDLSYTEVSL